MKEQQSDISLGRRRVVLGLTGLVGVMVTGCSFDSSTSAPTSQGTPTGAPQAAITPTPKVAQGTTLYVYQKHTIQIDDIAWSPDSASIISVSNGIFSQVGKGTPPQTYMWDARTGESNAIVTANPEALGLAPLAWSPDGKMIATSGYPDGGGNVPVFFWDTQTGKSLGTYENHGEISQLTWSSDSSRLAIASTHNVEICNATTRKKVLSYPASLVSGTVQSSNVVAWSPDGSTIASAAAKVGHSLQFWNAHSSTGQVLLTCRAKLPTFGQSPLYGFSQNPHTISWSPESTSIAIATDQNQVQIWNVTTQKLMYTYIEHNGPVSAVAWSPDGSRIASASYDKTVRVWQAF